MNIVVIRGASRITPEVHRAIQANAGEWDVIRDAEIVIGIKGDEAYVLKAPDTGEEAEAVPSIDLRERATQYRENGEKLIVKIGAEPKDGDVRTTSGIPIRGVTRITVEDDMEGGRALMLRVRGADIEFPSDPEGK